jgi:hypothetical protein
MPPATSASAAATSFAVELRVPRAAAFRFGCDLRLAVHAALELAHDAREMAMHRGARRIGVACSDGS